MLFRSIKDSRTVEGRIYGRLRLLENLRKTHPAFVSDADVWTLETHEKSVLCIGRCCGEEKIIGIFNFSEQAKTAWINETDGAYMDLIGGNEMEAKDVNIPGYGFYWLRLEKRERTMSRLL